MNYRNPAIVACLALGLAAPALAQDSEKPSQDQAADQTKEQPVDAHADDPTAVLGFTMETIEGETQELSEYKGKVVLMVNVASKCGLTPQYEALEAMYSEYKDRGLVVLGFPANNFRGQEPGTNEEILEFCQATYGVQFPMFGKISVLGDDQHPLYAKLAAAMEQQGGEPTWNFTKYLVDRSGHVVKRFDPRTAPGDKEMVAEVERLLAEPAPEKTESGA